MCLKEKVKVSVDCRNLGEVVCVYGVFVDRVVGYGSWEGIEVGLEVGFLVL